MLCEFSNEKLNTLPLDKSFDDNQDFDPSVIMETLETTKTKKELKPTGNLNVNKS